MKPEARLLPGPNLGLGAVLVRSGTVVRGQATGRPHVAAFRVVDVFPETYFPGRFNAQMPCECVAA